MQIERVKDVGTGMAMATIAVSTVHFIDVAAGTPIGLTSGVLLGASIFSFYLSTNDKVASALLRVVR